ncbi:hypothetical protein [Amycolatopsis vastitatis]|uniref:Glycosyltransferase RgtA/B/C/D-like domain-containing protein n=1 Tax=Amycolatopsis vastitatis TaxID=1905142 RepID=A0A229TKA9_9PSEU|nr:hypothetical protein [Amycolatopsis vastitatis]OXM71139.1 hypothetical protein CF165_01470 [Amycolatopsis vastitatis]
MRSASAELPKAAGALPVAVPVARSWVLPSAAAAASTLVFALVSHHLIDDTYITLSYAKNLAFHAHWGLIEQGTANTATSPLNVLALAAVTFVVRDAVLAAGIVFVAAQVLLVLGLRRLGERTGLPAAFAPLTFALLLVNPLLLSSVGLEVALGATGVVWTLVYAGERSPGRLGVMIGLLALVRLDLLLIAAVVFAARREFWDGIWRTAFAALAVTLPWFAFSWVVLGSAVPDTLVIKISQQSWGPFGFTNGPLLYWRNFPAAAALSFLPLLLGGLAGMAWIVQYRRGSETARRLTPFAALAVAGALHYLAYSRLGVPPYHWYYAPSIIGATIFLAAYASAVPERVRRATWTLAGMTLAASVAVYALPGIPRQFAPITSNHASTTEYREIGRQLAAIAHGRKVETAGEVGALAYACDCELVDEFSDRGAVDPAITETKRRSGEIGRALLEANFHNFDHSVAPLSPDLVLATTRRAPPPAALASWHIDSPWMGSQNLYLLPAHTSGG